MNTIVYLAALVLLVVAVSVMFWEPLKGRSKNLFEKTTLVLFVLAGVILVIGGDLLRWIKGSALVRFCLLKQPSVWSCHNCDTPIFGQHAEEEIPVWFNSHQSLIRFRCPKCGAPVFVRMSPEEKDWPQVMRTIDQFNTVPVGGK